MWGHPHQSRSKSGDLPKVMLTWLVVVPSMARAAPRRYIPEGLFDPAQFGVPIWPTGTHIVRRELGTDIEEPGQRLFNAGITTLPAELRAAYGAPYLASFKRRACQCYLFEEGEGGKKTRDPENFPFVSYPYMAVLNRDLSLNTMLDIDWNTSAWTSEFWYQAMDVRLETRPGFGPSVLMHTCAWVLEEPHYRYFFSFLDLPSSGEGRASIREFAHPDITESHPWFLGYGQNFGVMWPGGDDTHFSILHWLSEPRLDVRVGIPPRRDSLMVELNEDGSPNGTMGNGLPEPYAQGLHGNGSPVHLGPYCPNLQMILGHSHLNSVVPAHKEYDAKPGETRWGNTYFHRLVAFDRQSKTVVATSPSFCFPGETDPTRCETIQFVTGVEHVLRDIDEKTVPKLMFVYGINDCSNGVLEIPLHEVIEYLGLCREGMSVHCHCGMFNHHRKTITLGE